MVDANDVHPVKDATLEEAAAIDAMHDRVAMCPKIVAYDGWKGFITRIYVEYRGERPPSPEEVMSDPDLQPFFQEMLLCLGPCELSTPSVYYSSEPGLGIWHIVVARQK